MEQQEKVTINPLNLLTVAQYAKLVGKERQTIYNWVKDGKIQLVQAMGKTWVDKSTLKA
mgnify:CR=1 FL=1